MRDLAKHYAIGKRRRLGDQLTRVDNLAADHRGGLMGLGAVLTVTSAPLRTSPVKRGDWILRRVLDTPVPPPPANAGLDRGRRFARRREDGPPAAGSSSPRCHVRQLPFADRSAGLCVGALRPARPLARRHIATVSRSMMPSRWATAPPVSGPEGLRSYLQEHQDAVLSNTVRPSCWPIRWAAANWRPTVSLSTKCWRNVRSGDGSIAELVVDIVNSRQFRHRRGISLQGRRLQARGESMNMQTAACSRPRSPAFRAAPFCAARALR